METTNDLKLESLVNAFSAALLAKLEAAKEKYNYNDDWEEDGWQDSLNHQLLDHLKKGDPIDVAAYCAFAWFHDWKVSLSVDSEIVRWHRFKNEKPEEGGLVCVRPSGYGKTVPRELFIFNADGPCWCLGAVARERCRDGDLWTPFPRGPEN